MCGTGECVVALPTWRLEAFARLWKYSLEAQGASLPLLAPPPVGGAARSAGWITPAHTSASTSTPSALYWSEEKSSLTMRPWKETRLSRNAENPEEVE